jgi:hypothetical protein
MLTSFKELTVSTFPFMAGILDYSCMDPTLSKELFNSHSFYSLTQETYTSLITETETLSGSFLTLQLNRELLLIPDFGNKGASNIRQQ